ncbi:protein gp37 [Parabacteroides sp. PF5-5]|uniref:DUF5131 family protein n=1 Tax=unclassified Parabacteroides TaxID=2649774 RepID=UPI002473632E|nr:MULTISPECIES: phage Gp37/Gp68 family protein [unclassified Parabacteroides]MDH6304282.1 protein gp37 [Parabacteroides sp. PH5-39]MDH6315003.1 protein gp37 [Parabacteroides sp. PF5-13]MDH6318663.1 protein gp37 [Parabacteroides sp. PH5-13]MDH6322393.1 protein gp37 [Parabacteroides sp. PH5-8]MDH6326472.1 protein gp37 [Parabacteroides sp. PH5-41]
MNKTNIEWADYIWNPITGCTQISDGCANCYAKEITEDFQSKGSFKYRAGFNTVVCHERLLNEPDYEKEPGRVFANSMSDFFHKDVLFEFLQRIFQVMHRNPHLDFQILTKRADRLLELSPHLTWTDNIWMGVTVENEKVINRIDQLRETGAKLKFLSIEPLLGPLNNLNLTGIDWVIVGGEKGRNARPMKKEWVLDIQQQCEEQNVTFFFKQWGGRYGNGGNLLNGKTYMNFPK